MQIARAVRECVTLVEQQTGMKIDVMSLAYNRLMNHVRYMVARALSGERLKLNMNDYMRVKFPEAYETAAVICEEIGRSLNRKLDDVETGYQAMHIERVKDDETTGSANNKAKKDNGGISCWSRSLKVSCVNWAWSGWSTHCFTMRQWESGSE